MALIDLAADNARRWAKRLEVEGISAGELAILLGIRRSDAVAVLHGNVPLMPGAELRLYVALNEIEFRRRYQAR
jgi:hypothetical protein